PELVHLLDVKASVLLARDRTGPAIEALERSLEVASVAHGPRSSLVGVSLVNLGNAQVQAGDRARGRELYAQAVEILRERLGPDHDWTMMSVDNLAEVTARLGEPDAAEAMLEENVARRRRVLGEDHPSIAYSYSALGMAMASRGEWTRAAAQFERASGVHAASSGDRSVPYLSALSNFAFCLFRAGDYERAEDAQRRVIEIERATTSGGAGVLWGDFRSLVRIYLAQGDAQGALEAVEELRGVLFAEGEPSPDRARMFAAL